MTITREQAARTLGMKPREVVRWDGTVAVLHDGTRFEFDKDGAYRQLERVQRDVPRTADGHFVADWTRHPAGQELAAPVDEPVDSRTRPVVAHGDDDPGSLPAGTAAGPRPLTPSDPAATDQARRAGPATGVDEEVPGGSEKELLAWVGTDQTRAARALAAEKAADKPRGGVVSKLEKLASD
jgi:hypothetical protein